MPTEYNFFAPFFQAQIIASDKETIIPLWQGPLPNIPAGLGYKSATKVLATNLAMAAELTVELSLGSYFILKVTLSPTYEDALALMNSNIIVQGVSQLQCRFGYMGAGQVMSEWYTGLIMEPDFTIGVDYTLSFKAHATAGAALRKQEATRQFPNKTRKQIIEELVKGSGKEAVPLTLDWGLVTGKEELKRLDETINYEQGGKNDWLAIAEVLSQCLCTYRLSDKVKGKPGDSVIQIIDQEQRFGSTATRTFRLYAPQDPKKTTSAAAGMYKGVKGSSGGIYPILTVSSTSKQIFLEGVTKGYIKPAFDEKKKELTPPKVEDIDKDIPVKVAAPSASPNKKAGKGLVASPTNPAVDANKGGGGAIQTGDVNSPTQAAKNSRDLYDKSISAGIQLNIESVGVPDFVPGEVVEVQGLGLKLDGTYSVFKITHTVGTNGFTSRFDCISNGGYPDAKNSLVKAMQVNTASPPDEGSENRTSEQQ